LSVDHQMCDKVWQIHILEWQFWNRTMVRNKELGIQNVFLRHVSFAFHFCWPFAYLHAYICAYVHTGVQSYMHTVSKCTLLNAHVCIFINSCHSVQMTLSELFRTYNWNTFPWAVMFHFPAGEKIYVKWEVLIFCNAKRGKERWGVGTKRRTEVGFITV